MKIFPEFYIEENNLIELIEVTCKMLDYGFGIYEKEDCRRLEINKKNNSPDILHYVLIKRDMHTGRLVVGYFEMVDNKRTFVVHADTYDAKEYIYVLKETFDIL